MMPAARRWTGPAAMLMLLGVMMVLRLVAGPTGLGLHTLWQALAHPDGTDFAQHILRVLRLPRALGVALAGACLGSAGYLLQLALRNPLAEPQLLGLNAGASLAMVLATAWPPLALSGIGRPLLAGLGAFLCFLAVLVLGQPRRSGADPMRLVFCGIAISALAHAATSAILLLDSETLEELRFWLIGDGASARAGVLGSALPVALGGLVLAVLALPGLRIVQLGQRVAQGLGVRTGGLMVLALLASAALTGAAVSITGPIGFVGMLAPLCWPRALSGPSLPGLALIGLTGAVILLGADLAAANLLYPREVPTGALTGLMGAPFFLRLCLKGARPEGIRT